MVHIYENDNNNSNDDEDSSILAVQQQEEQENNSSGNNTTLATTAAEVETIKTTTNNTDTIKDINDHAILTNEENIEEEEDDGDDKDRLISNHNQNSSVSNSSSSNSSISSTPRSLNNNNNKSHSIDKDEVELTTYHISKNGEMRPTTITTNHHESGLVVDYHSDLNEEDFISVNDSGYFKPFGSRFLEKNIYYEKILNVSNKLRVDATIHKSELILTAAFLFCFISLGISVGSLGPTLILLKDNTNSTLDMVGYFFTARGLGYFIGSFASRVYDRVNGNFLVAGSVLFMSIVLFLIPLLKNVWLAGGLFFFEGIFAGLIDCGLNTMIVWVWKEKVNPFMQLLHFSFGVGAFLAPLVVSQMVGKTLFFQYTILAAIMFVPALTIVLLKPAKPFHHEEMDGAPVSKIERTLRLQVIVAMAFFLFFYVGSEMGYGAWVFTYSKLNLSLSDESAALLNSLFWGSFTFGRLAGVFVSLFLSPQQMVITDTLGCFFFAILLILFPSSQTILWISTAGLGISLASIFPTAFSLPNNLNMPVTSRTTSYMVIGATVGELSIPWATGVLQHHIGMHVLPWIVFLSLLVSLTIYIGVNLQTVRMRSKDRGHSFNLSWKSVVSLLENK
ncbi:hypothetical protein CYY_008248 [Polysphondylium violaceum]|uniref:Major facilitator superfamily (MFS) profile domain-containing protein n=1 Tax=Polysphondylium violaceum TaxID=133409 RepID=A0A8J4PLY6_9MYCE|nr:hypothetical protein CYY_008248 [Polysphondylium violaceum]